jgi:aminopeptidase YwaD
MMKFYICVLVCAFQLVFTFNGFAQDKDYVMQVVKDLSSEKMHGRGYVKKGVNKAAKYLSKEMDRIGLLAFENNYFQDFAYSVNTFPKNTYVAINGKELKAGYEYMPGPASPRFKGDYEVIMFDSITYNDTVLFLKLVNENKPSSKFIVLDFTIVKDRDIRMFYINLMRNNPLNAGGYIEKLNNNLMWAVRGFQNDFPTIKISEDVFPNNIETISLNIKPKLIDLFKTSNVIGYLPTKDKNADYIVFTAHYDHLGRIGKEVYIPGAQDNASGTATILDLAKHYVEKGSNYNLAFMLFSGEEAGLYGSFNYVTNPYFNLDKIKAVINLDMVGTGDDGITIVNGGAEGYEELFNCIDSINSANRYFEVLKARGESANSDHFPFHMLGVKAIFIYSMGGKTFYHNPKDKPETLTFTGYENLFNLITDFVEHYE